MNGLVEGHRPLKVLTWDIDRTSKERARAIVKLLCGEMADVNILIGCPGSPDGRDTRKPDSHSYLCGLLTEHGWQYQIEPDQVQEERVVLIASRTPLNLVKSDLRVEAITRTPADLQARWVEAELQAWTFTTDSGRAIPLRIAAIDNPGSEDSGETVRQKQAFWEATLALLKERSDLPFVLCGKMGTGFEIDRGGNDSFTCVEYLTRLRDDLGWIDVWREMHRSAREYTWSWRKDNKRSGGNGYRLDQVWVPPILKDACNSSWHRHDTGTRRSAIVVQINAMLNELPKEITEDSGPYQGVLPGFAVSSTGQLRAIVEQDLQAMASEEPFVEGQQSQALVNIYERDSELRTEVIRRKGTSCQVCGFNFEAVYGDVGKDFIEVHHLRPISTYGGSVKVNPDTDMAVVCANCHRMIHRRQDHPLGLDELRRCFKADLGQ